MTFPVNLELVSEIVEADYSWTAVGVFKDKVTGDFFWGTDSGCSCNSPWESTSRADLTPLRHGALSELVEAAKGVRDPGTSVLEFIGEVEAAMDAQYKLAEQAGKVADVAS